MKFPTYRGCRLCVMRVPSRRRLARHYWKAHVRAAFRRKPVPRSPRTATCITCGNVVRRRVTKRHWMGETPVECPFCGTQFSVSRWQAVAP